MAGDFGTQTDVMQTASRHVVDVNTSIQTQLKKLENQLAPLPAQWQGLAAQRFTELMVRWNEDARTLGDSLMRMGEAIGSSGQTYRAADDDAAAATSTIRQALG